MADTKQVSPHSRLVMANNERYRQRNRVYVLEYLTTHPCETCGESDPVVLEFDHVRGDKVNSIAKMMERGTSLRKLDEEIAKCMVLCANCHRRKTAKELGWFRSTKPA